ncbi:ankyrin repeat-containing protein bda1 [Quercus suber]|uniref:Ankyrin repeat-containing protein bda1 n=1 Tax=Quercus suber TaxID=58331 RepID=A0AAW0IUI2_QUESU
MDERIGRMKQVAEKGNIDGFYDLIQEDVKYLEYMDEFPFVDTPLHIAASAGNIPVAMEMMRLKPSFARKPNRDGFSPIELALQNGHTEMVHQLLHVDQDLVRVRGKGNMTPLHHVAKGNDQLDLLTKFISICPDSIADVTTQNETALHIALKNDSIDSFKALVGWLASNWSQNALDYERKILNWKDEDGNTALHIAAVRHLFAWSSEVDVKIKNKEGKTAWGILEAQTQVGNSESEMRKMLIRVGASKGSSITTDSPYAYYLRPPKCRRLEKIRTKYARQMTTISDDKRNALLVVAALLIAVTYQAALSPPGGLQETIKKPDKDCRDAPCAKWKTNDDSWRTTQISTSQAYGPSQADGPTPAFGPSQTNGPTPAFGPSQADGDGPTPAFGPSQANGPTPAAFGPSQANGPTPAFGPSQADGPTPAFGPSQANRPTSPTANLVNTIPFSMFLFSNSVTFLISNSVTILLIPDGYIGWMLSGTQAFLWACYIVSFVAITGYTYFWITLISIGSTLYLILLQAVRRLFAWSSEVDVKIKNKVGKTAWGILEAQRQVGNSES